MKSSKLRAEIHARYQLTRSARVVADDLGISHNTVLAVLRQDSQGVKSTGARPRLIDAYWCHVVQWVESSGGRIRADVVHDKLQAMGFIGSERTTRRAVREVKDLYAASRVRRAHRPWLVEPGLWLQYDFAKGPVVDGESTVLFLAWLAYSRFRVVVALRNRKMTSVLGALDRAFRAVGGVPRYVLTDNEKTVVVDRHAGIPEFHPTMELFCAHYRTQIHVCAPADPATKGGVENAVKIAKADLLPTQANLRDEYNSFAQLEVACQEFMDKVNFRAHRTTGIPPIEMLEEVEGPVLSPLPVYAPYHLFGQLRKVPKNTPMVSFEKATYSVPEELMGAEVYVTVQSTADGEDVVLYYHDLNGVEEIARHLKGKRGDCRINPEHFSYQRPQAPGDYALKPQSRLEKEFLAIGPHAEKWLRIAVAKHYRQIKITMTTVCAISQQYGTSFADHLLSQGIRQGLTTGPDFEHLAELLPRVDYPKSMANDLPEPLTLSRAENSWGGFFTSYSPLPTPEDHIDPATHHSNKDHNAS